MERGRLPLTGIPLPTEMTTTLRVRHNPTSSCDDDELTKNLYKSPSTVRAAKSMMGRENFLESGHLEDQETGGRITLR
jgi:hypothetical protein